MSRLSDRLQRLEATTEKINSGGAMVFLNHEGERIGAQRHGQPYDGPIEEGGILVEVQFVTPPDRPDDDKG